MKYNFVKIYFFKKIEHKGMFLYILLGLFLTTTCIKPKLCINCKYYINYSGFKSDAIYGKCLLSSKNDDINFLISGEKKLEYCLTSRSSENMCGKEGKLYIRKYIKDKK